MRAFGLKLLSSPGTIINVIITTIPPLGLSASDAREAVRQEVNSDIISNTSATFQADGYLDFDGAVANSANPHELDPSYLTNNAPNASYYQTLANIVVTNSFEL